MSKLASCATSLILIFSVTGLAAESNPSANELTAQDQGTSKTDIALTQKIRAEVVRQKALSTDAKNIKIISIDGDVTLKGTVRSVSEKKQVEKIAMRIAGTKKVASQIEIAQ